MRLLRLHHFCWHTATCAVLAAPAVAQAESPGGFVDIDPVTGGDYGYGYDTATRQLRAPCVSFKRSATYETGSPSQNDKFEFAESTATMAAEMDLSVHAALSVLTTGGRVSADNKTRIATGRETSSYNQTLYALSYSYNRPKFLKLGHVKFKKEPLSMLKDTRGGKGAFRAKCGDAFVIGVQDGREFIGTATLKKQALHDWMRFSNKTGIDVNGGAYKAKVGVDLAKAMDESFGSTNISIELHSTSSKQRSPSSVKELAKYYQNFLRSGGASKTVKLILAPYNMVDGYPWESPLEGDDKDDYIGMMVVALWQLKAAIADAEFVLNANTRPMFALGKNKKAKKARLSYIKAQKKAWYKEFDMLLKAAKSCDKKFEKGCRKLGKYYDRSRNLDNQVGRVLPERYVSDCYAPINISDQLEASLNELFGPKHNVNFGTPICGDSEGGGGSSRSRVVAELTFRPNGRRLDADLSVARLEWKGKASKNQPLRCSRRGESGWSLRASTRAFDLEPKSMLEDANYSQCLWVGKGVKLAEIKTPEAASYFGRDGLTQRKTHGLIDEISGRRPRGYINFGNGKGALKWIKCEADRKGKDNNLRCSGIGLQTIRLALLSDQDRVADGWKAPKSPEVPKALTAFLAKKKVSEKESEAQYKEMSEGMTQKRAAAAEAAAKKHKAALDKMRARTKQLKLDKKRAKERKKSDKKSYDK